MATNYPTSLDTFTNPSSGASLSSPSHAGQHSDINDAVEAVEAKLGIGASAASSAGNGAVLTANGSGSTSWGLGGLTLVKSDIFTGTATSRTVSSAFDSRFTAYRVIYTIQSSATGGLRIALGATSTNTSGWYGSEPYWGYNGTDGVIRTNNQGQAETGFTDSAVATYASFDLMNPFATAKSYINGTAIGRDVFSVTYSYVLNNTTSYSAFTLSCSAGGQLTSGSIYVYGYRPT